jgi:hypothetical protein
MQQINSQFKHKRVARKGDQIINDMLKSSAGGTPTDAAGSASALLRRDKTVALPPESCQG